MSMMTFVTESNKIEGILREPTIDEVSIHEEFIKLPPYELRLPRFVDLVKVLQPDAIIRDRPNLNVRVGNHIAPSGGHQILVDLRKLIQGATEHGWHPFDVHCEYEQLHPFTDGNGRSGRAFWLWCMKQRFPGSYRDILGKGFLHLFYYQTLARYSVLKKD